MKSLVLLVTALVVAAALPVAPPAAAASPSLTLADAVRAAILEATGGEWPETAVVDGGLGPRVVTLDEFLAPFADPAFVMGSESDGVVLPSKDVGVGGRTGEACTPAGVALALTLGNDALKEAPSFLSQDEGVVECGVLTHRSAFGDRSASVAGYSLLTAACVAGTFAARGGPCTGDFHSVGMLGRTGVIGAQLCVFIFCFTLEVMIGGSPKSPLPNRSDAVLVTLA